jgi:hypothetical protein
MEREYEDRTLPPPRKTEPICMPSYIIAITRVGGGPEERTGFWPAYREALEYNRKTKYHNARLKICLPIIKQVEAQNPDWNKIPLYYRNGSLTEERLAKSISAFLGN